MPKIVELQVYYHNTDDEQTHVVKQVPTSQDTPAIKLQVAKIVTAIRDRAEYYYMVVKVRKDNGDYGYRTIIPKTLL